MSTEEILVCVSDDIGIRTWLERSLQGAWPVEFVGSSDLSRITRLVSATGTGVVMVSADENDPGKALRIISALTKADEDLVVVSVVRRVAQDFLLQSMRAGARDCFVASSDGEELRRRIIEFRSGTSSVRQRSESVHEDKIVLVTSASPVVDTRFFAQNLTFATNYYHPEARVLGLDTMADDRHAFYLDSNNRLTLENLLRNPDSLDASLIETALEEYLPNLRFLSGQLPTLSEGEELNTDLFIVMRQLASLFDRIIVNVDPAVADFWVNTVGLNARDLVMLIHPVVEQAHEARRRLDSWQECLPSSCAQSFLLDGFEGGRGVPSMAELERAVGIKALGALPLDWTNRLSAINAGIPLHQVPGRSNYQRELLKVLKRYEADRIQDVA
ncbi:hypothetical protein FWJ25_09230 [Marinobacter salinexigens]|uniref:Pilus assembly protein TadZ N-terminal domain-containing protein n=1 Tax=Marinobacter salinexigens TaxID=2919747 RepID=A0A5B0VIY0_9GAMM|nr:hypothetical protein [Marinobacter salinexigens]KAA1174404.1 hypothetical protein FWJ25_09230 [Marinobacter salinexigens]